MMHGHLTRVLAGSALIALLGQMPTAPGECCGPTTYRDGSLADSRCADCKHPQGSYCGAYGGGGCNVFGCNCGNGCIQPVPGLTCSASCCNRHDRSARRHDIGAVPTPAGNYSGHDVINVGDLDKDGHLDEVEVHVYLTQRGVFFDDVTAPWRKLDTNSDGRLTAAEIDHDLHATDDVTVL